MKDHLCCGRVPMQPGDWVVGDASGVVVVPANMLAQVSEKAEAIHHKETAMAAHLHNGKDLSSAVEAAVRAAR